MGLFTFVCGVFAFIVAASFALSSTDPKPLSIEVLAWKEQGRIVKGPAGQNVFVVDLAGRNVNGSTLVIGHGFPTSSFEWREMIPRLIPHFARVVVFDYVGFGLSDKPVLDAGVYSVADHADTLLFVLEMTRSKDLELLCHDMSDSVCSEALSRGLKVRRVTFLNGGMRYRHANLRLSQQILLSPLGSWFSKLPIETFFKKQIRTLFANQSAISDEELDQWFNLMGYNHGLQNMHRLIEYIRDRHRFEPRWTRALQATSVPIRLIWGALDAVAPLVIAQEVAQLVPKATLTTIAAGHWPFVEKPDEFIDAFLNK